MDSGTPSIFSVFCYPREALTDSCLLLKASVNQPLIIGRRSGKQQSAKRYQPLAKRKAVKPGPA
jgi:hypothetical protein